MCGTTSASTKRRMASRTMSCSSDHSYMGLISSARYATTWVEATGQRSNPYS